MRKLLMATVGLFALGQTALASDDVFTVPEGEILAIKQIAQTTKPYKCEVNRQNVAEENWVKIWESCQGSPVATANAILYLLRDGQLTYARTIADKAVLWHPNNRMVMDAYNMTTNPFDAVAEITNAKLNAWLSSSSKHGSFDQTLPKKKDYPPLPELVKGEFEKKADFQKRVEKMRQKRAKEIAKIEADYAKAVESYNAAVKKYNAKIEKEKAERQKQVAKKRLEFVKESFADVFGNPQFEKAKYDAEDEVFYADLVSSNGIFTESVKIQVPIGVAKQFKDKLAVVEPRVKFTIDNSTIMMADIQAVLGKTTYVASLTSEQVDLGPVRVKLADATSSQQNQLSTLTPEEIGTDVAIAQSNEYFDSITLEEDPELTKLRQQKAELDEKKRLALLEQAREVERERLRKEIEAQQEQLASLGGSAAEDLKGLKQTTQWSFKRGKPNTNMIAVVIGNRDYDKGIPLVHYAKNDAKAVAQFARETLGLPPENIIHEENATKGTMQGIFESTLPARVKPGETDVFVYFSGHGMPVNQDAKLLPVDARPNTAGITGYSRDLLIAQLDSLGARSLTIVLDSCFSGTSKGGETLIAAKAILPEAKTSSIPENAIMISASRGNQTAWSDDQSGHSLLTYHMLEAFRGKADDNSDGRIASSEVSSYLIEHVNRASLRMNELPQEPEVTGTERILVHY